MSAATTFRFDFHGVSIHVESDDAALIGLLRGRFRRFPPPGASAPMLRFVLQRAKAGMKRMEIPAAARPVYDLTDGTVLYDDASGRIYLRHGRSVDMSVDPASGTAHGWLIQHPEAAWIASRPLFTIALLELLKRRGLFGLHAALLARGSDGILVAGSSGAGKSTLALCLLRAGYRFGGDDMCFLDPAVNAVCARALPDEIDVAESTMKFFPELANGSGHTRPPGARKWLLTPEDVYPVDFVQRCTPRLLLLPQIGEHAITVAEPVLPADALLDIVPNVLLTDARASQAHLDVLAMLTTQGRCWRLRTGRDFDRIPRVVAELLQQSMPVARSHGHTPAAVPARH
ncbi:MAG TPA: hypothetical protein VFU06_09920 [Longimicrobiales bacterium]|nr:hypothetical protein [Longimicrobiales bacterium]